jgi:hypothetical protein
LRAAALRSFRAVPRQPSLPSDGRNRRHQPAYSDDVGRAFRLKSATDSD